MYILLPHISFTAIMIHDMIPRKDLKLLSANWVSFFFKLICFVIIKYFVYFLKSLHNSKLNLLLTIGDLSVIWRVCRQVGDYKPKIVILLLSSSVEDASMMASWWFSRSAIENDIYTSLNLFNSCWASKSPSWWRLRAYLDSTFRE